MAGLPRAFAAPWERVGLSAPIPVADAARERRLVWVGGEEEMARHYPRIAVVLPYPFALAAVPVATASTVYGAVFVTWPGAHPPELSDHEREHLTAACGRLAVRLERAAELSIPPHPETDMLASPLVSGIAGTLGTVEAARMVVGLPYGLVSLDLHGRIGFVNAAAAELLNVPVNAAARHPAVGIGAVAQRPGVRGPLPGRAAEPAHHLVRGAAPARRVAVVPAVSEHHGPQCPDHQVAGRVGDEPGGTAVRREAVPAGHHVAGAGPGQRPHRGGGGSGRGAAGGGRDRPGRGQPGPGRAGLAGEPAARARASRVPGRARGGTVRRDAADRADARHTGAAHGRARVLRVAGTAGAPLPGAARHPRRVRCLGLSAVDRPGTAGGDVRALLHGAAPLPDGGAVGDDQPGRADRPGAGAGTALRRQAPARARPPGGAAAALAAVAARDRGGRAAMCPPLRAWTSAATSTTWCAPRGWRPR